MVWHSDGEQRLRTRLAVLTQYRHVTDKRRTNGQTDRHLAMAQSELCIALRNNKIVSTVIRLSVC